MPPRAACTAGLLISGQRIMPSMPIPRAAHAEGADPTKVSDRAKKRGLVQLGSLGSGNHYTEIQVPPLPLGGLEVALQACPGRSLQLEEGRLCC